MTFVMFLDAYRKMRRVRLLWQAADWPWADERAEVDRVRCEQYVLGALVRYVVTMRRPCTLDTFLHVHADLPLPRRGDLVRLLHKHRHVIRFDRNTFELSLPH